METKDNATIDVPTTVVATVTVAGVDEAAATRLRRAATALLILTLPFSFIPLGFAAGIIASLCVLMVSSTAVPKKSRCIRFCAIIAVSVAIIEAFALTGALMHHTPERIALEFEEQCNSVPPSTFMWGKDALRSLVGCHNEQREYDHPIFVPEPEIHSTAEAPHEPTTIPTSLAYPNDDPPHPMTMGHPRPRGEGEGEAPHHAPPYHDHSFTTEEAPRSLAYGDAAPPHNGEPTETPPRPPTSSEAAFGAHSDVHSGVVTVSLMSSSTSSPGPSTDTMFPSTMPSSISTRRQYMQSSFSQQRECHQASYYVYKSTHALLMLGVVIKVGVITAGFLLLKRLAQLVHTPRGATQLIA